MDINKIQQTSITTDENALQRKLPNDLITHYVFAYLVRLMDEDVEGEPDEDEEIVGELIDE